MHFLNRWHLVAVLCGAVPLVAGTGIFLVWLVARQSWLTLAGAAMLAIGLVAFVAGVAALARCCWVAAHTPGVPPSRIWIAALVSVFLLLVNFPVAGAIVWSAIAIGTRYTVVVHNTSQDQLDDVRAFGGGCDATFGTLLPGATASRSFWIQRDGVITFRASIAGNAIEEPVDSYITTDSGGHRTVTVQPGQKVVVTAETARELPFPERMRSALFWQNRALCQ